MLERQMIPARRQSVLGRVLPPMAILACALFVSGCALPPAIQVASWALTGFSYAATGKGPTDHAISLAMEEDCAIHQVAVDGDMCDPYMDNSAPFMPETMLADIPQPAPSTAVATAPREFMEELQLFQAVGPNGDHPELGSLQQADLRPASHASSLGDL